jgi:hypothetical protein
MTIQVQSGKFSGLVEAYNALVEKIRKDIPVLDVDFVTELLIHSRKYPEEIPKLRLEITYARNISGVQKRDQIYARTGRCAEIRHNHMLIVDGHFKLNDVEEFTKDSDVKYIVGSIIH